jgi:16S rRNA (cytidine1402-2'-O)-methyltransferase
MTKMYEEYWRGTISSGIEHFKAKEPRGEFTLVVEGKGKEERSTWTKEELLKAIRKELKAGKSAKETSAELAERSGWNKKEVYNLAHHSSKDR